MDLQKRKEEFIKIIENSQLSTETKDFIYKLLPHYEQVEVRQQIMDLIDLETNLAASLADESTEVYQAIKSAAREIEDNDINSKDQVAEVILELNAKLDAIKGDMDAQKEEVNKQAESYRQSNPSNQ